MPESYAAYGLMLLTALGWGAAHGLDADHIATIDGLTRWQASRRSGRPVRWTGCAFSLGHGLVVISVTAAATWLGTLTLPGWLSASGVGVSVACLLSLGWINFAQAWATHSDTASAPSAHAHGWRSVLLNRWIHNVRAPRSLPWAVGGLFALSLDTLSQAAAFSLSGHQMAQQLGVPALAGPLACGLGLSFVLGMLLADGLNGWILGTLLTRSRQTGPQAQRWFAAIIAGLAWLVAVLMLARYTSSHVGRWLEGQDLGLGLCVATAAVMALVVTNSLQRRHTHAS